MTGRPWNWHKRLIISAFWNKISPRDHVNKMAHHMNTDTYIYAYTCAYIIWTKIYTYMHVQTHTSHEHRYTHICMYILIHHMNTDICIYACTYSLYSPTSAQTHPNTTQNEQQTQDMEVLMWEGKCKIKSVNTATLPEWGHEKKVSMTLGRVWALCLWRWAQDELLFFLLPSMDNKHSNLRMVDTKKPHHGNHLILPGASWEHCISSCPQCHPRIATATYVNQRGWHDS